MRRGTQRIFQGSTGFKKKGGRGKPADAWAEWEWGQGLEATSVLLFYP